MSNTYGISASDEAEIRARDSACVYCRKVMGGGIGTKDHYKDRATIEHFHNDGPFNEKFYAAICCGSCNSSRGAKDLSVWFKTAYCIERNISEETVAEPVKEYLRSLSN
ncbi:MAG: HNH endonuclease [Patescibacteria group bacterium]|jgi:hypothetical protein